MPMPHPIRLSPPLIRRAPQAGLWLLLLALGACAGAPAPGPESPRADRTAQAAENRGDWEAAALLWEEAAAQSGKPDPDRLRAADAWLQAGEFQRAREQLERVRLGRLTRAQASQHALISAELALAAGDVDLAAFFLEAVDSSLHSTWAGRHRAALHGLELLRADPYAPSLGLASAAAREISGFDVIDGVKVLELLEGVPSSRLARLAVDDTPLGQWAAVTLAVRETLVDGGDLLAASERWSAAHPDSFIDGAAFMELSWQYGQRFPKPSRVAILLPSAGPLAAAGAALRDGILGAYLAEPGAELTFLDAPDSPSGALRAYLDAADAGFQWVIGPLSQDSVQALADHGTWPVPTLTLNQYSLPRESRTPGLYGIALTPGGEAEALARKMLESGVRRVLILSADTAWGQRSEQAFREAFLHAGGLVVASEVFNPAQPDHSERLTRLLQIEASRERRSQLQSALGISLQFEPTRRDDFDAIFLAAEPALARQLKPQLRFFDAGDEPVFAMSRVFSGRIDPSNDIDLNGIIFGATRWAFGDAHGLDLASLRGGNFGSLYQLGSDAWNVIALLPLLATDSELEYPGATGRLRLQADGQLQRTPLWAVFQGGRPVPWDAPPGP